MASRDSLHGMVEVKELIKFYGTIRPYNNVIFCQIVRQVILRVSKTHWPFFQVRMYIHGEIDKFFYTDLPIIIQIACLKK